jgi:hypothetical protein
MDYQKHYNLLISTRKELKREKNKGIYYENHHIIPRSMGGSYYKDNLILLTPREHFVAHWLLYKIYNNQQMSYAFWLMCCFNEKFKFTKSNSKTYEKLKQEIHQSLCGWNHTEESKIKMRTQKHSEESKRRIGEANSKPKPKSYGENLSKLMKEGLADKIGKANLGISRNKGRIITWKVGKPKTTIQQFKNDILIKEWIGISELEKEFGISSIYRAFKTNKEYNGFIWKKK